jgi:hypothetical protein
LWRCSDTEHFLTALTSGVSSLHNVFLIITWDLWKLRAILLKCDHFACLDSRKRQISRATCMWYDLTTWCHGQSYVISGRRTHRQLTIRILQTLSLIPSDAVLYPFTSSVSTVRSTPADTCTMQAAALYSVGRWMQVIQQEKCNVKFFAMRTLWTTFVGSRKPF